MIGSRRTLLTAFVGGCPFYDDGTSGSPLRLRALFQEFLNLMEPFAGARRDYPTSSPAIHRA
jgi:hypothetical protein